MVRAHNHLLPGRSLPCDELPAVKTGQGEEPVKDNSTVDPGAADRHGFQRIP